MTKQWLTLLFSACSFVSGRYIHNTISINVKGHFHLWYTTRGRRNSNLYSMKKITTEVMVAIVQTISITKDRDTLEKLVMVPVPWKHFLSMDVSHFFHLFYVTAVVLKFCVGNRHAVGQNWSTCVSLKFNHYVVKHPCAIMSFLSLHPKLVVNF